MEIDQNPNVGQKGRFYLTKNIWLPQEPIEKLNLKMSDMILRRMPSSVTQSPNASTRSPSLGLATYLSGCGQSVPHMMRSGAASISAR